MRSPTHLCAARHMPSRRARIPSAPEARSRRRGRSRHRVGAAGAERILHPVGVAEVERTLHPAGAAGAEAVGCSRRPVEAGAEAAGAGCHRVAVAAASPTSTSSYPTLGVVEPISKLRMIHACIACAYAAVKRAPTPQAITPKELMKLAAR